MQLEIIDEDSSMVNTDFFQDPKDNEKLYFYNKNLIDYYIQC